MSRTRTIVRPARFADEADEALDAFELKGKAAFAATLKAERAAERLCFNDGGSDAGGSDAGSDAGGSDAGSDAGGSDAGSDAGGSCRAR
jgi:hypothetical protein